MRNKEGLQTQAADDHHQRHLYECLPQERVQPSSCTQQYAGSGQLYTGSAQQYTGSTSQHPGSTMQYTGSSPQHTGSTPQYTGSTQQYTGLLRRREEEKHEEDLNEIRSDKYYYMRRFSIFFLFFISSLFPLSFAFRISTIFHMPFQSCLFWWFAIDVCEKFVKQHTLWTWKWKAFSSIANFLIFSWKEYFPFEKLHSYTNGIKRVLEFFFVVLWSWKNIKMRKFHF